MAAIFLSASVPVPGRGQYFQTTNVTLIRAAVSALVSVVMGRRLIVWGGHPAITPMLWAAAEDLGLHYRENVHLYQSRFFEDQFPEDNARFGNVTYVEGVANNRSASLKKLREEMFRKHEFEAGIFIGGMEGVFDEFEMFRRAHPTATLVPVSAPGGAAAQLAGSSRLDAFSVDFVMTFYKALDISPGEMRRRVMQSPAT